MCLCVRRVFFFYGVLWVWYAYVWTTHTLILANAMSHVCSIEFSCSTHIIMYFIHESFYYLSFLLIISSLCHLTHHRQLSVIATTLLFSNCSLYIRELFDWTLRISSARIHTKTLPLPECREWPICLSLPIERRRSFTHDLYRTKRKNKWKLKLMCSIRDCSL